MLKKTSSALSSSKLVNQAAPKVSLTHHFIVLSLHTNAG